MRLPQFIIENFTVFSFQIMNFPYEIINEEFKNDKIWVVIFKFSILTTLKTMMEFDSNPNLKIFDFPNNRFKPISNL